MNTEEEIANEQGLVQDIMVDSEFVATAAAITYPYKDAASTIKFFSSKLFSIEDKEENKDPDQV